MKEACSHFWGDEKRLPGLSPSLGPPPLPPPPLTYHPACLSSFRGASASGCPAGGPQALTGGCTAEWQGVLHRTVWATQGGSTIVGPTIPESVHWVIVLFLANLEAHRVQSLTLPHLFGTDLVPTRDGVLLPTALLQGARQWEALHVSSS